MIPLPAAIIAVVAAFAPGFSPPVWNPVQVLGVGVVLCPGARPVAGGAADHGTGAGTTVGSLSSGVKAGPRVGPASREDFTRATDTFTAGSRGADGGGG